MNLSWEDRLVQCHSCYDERFDDYIIRTFPSMLCSKRRCMHPPISKETNRPCILDVSLLPETIEYINAKRKLLRNKKFKNEIDIENIVKDFFN